MRVTPQCLSSPKHHVAGVSGVQQSAAHTALSQHGLARDGDSVPGLRCRTAFVPRLGSRFPFLAVPSDKKFPGPGIETAPQQQAKLLQRQHWALNLLQHTGASARLGFK